MNQAESHLSLETDNALEQGNINNKNMATLLLSKHIYQVQLFKGNCKSDD